MVTNQNNKQYAINSNNKGTALFRVGKYSEALETYDQALAFDKENPLIWRNKGYALYKLNNYVEAILAYEKAHSLDPNHADSWNSKGMAFLFIGKYEDALNAFERALQLKPNEKEFLKNRETASHELKKIQNNLSHAPEISRLLKTGAELLSQSDLKEALVIYNEILSIDSENIVAWKSKGKILEKIGKTDAAKIALDRAKMLELKESQLHTLSISSDNQDNESDINLISLLNKGNAFFTSSQLKEALLAYNEALLIDPNNITAWAAKEDIFKKMGMTTAAKVASEKVKTLTRSPTSDVSNNDINGKKPTQPHSSSISEESDDIQTTHSQNAQSFSKMDPSLKPQASNIHNEKPVKLLCTIIKNHGISYLNNEDAFQGILKDYFKGEFKRESIILTRSVIENIPQDILAKQDQIPFAVLSAQLTKRLDDCGFSPDLSIWAVYAWARALYVKTE